LFTLRYGQTFPFQPYLATKPRWGDIHPDHGGWLRLDAFAMEYRAGQRLL
jgi:hypothetical protein